MSERRLLGYRVWFSATGVPGERMYVTMNGEGVLSCFWRSGLKTKPSPRFRADLEEAVRRSSYSGRHHFVRVYAKPKKPAVKPLVDIVARNVMRAPFGEDVMVHLRKYGRDNLESCEKAAIAVAEEVISRLLRQGYIDKIMHCMLPRFVEALRSEAQL